MGTKWSQTILNCTHLNFEKVLFSNEQVHLLRVSCRVKSVLWGTLSVSVLHISNLRLNFGSTKFRCLWREVIYVASESALEAGCSNSICHLVSLKKGFINIHSFVEDIMFVTLLAQAAKWVWLIKIERHLQLSRNNDKPLKFVWVNSLITFLKLKASNYVLYWLNDISNICWFLFELRSIWNTPLWRNYHSLSCIISKSRILSFRQKCIFRRWNQSWD